MLVNQREIFPSQVGNYREIAGKSARKSHKNMNINYNINRLHNNKNFSPIQREMARLPVAPVPSLPGDPGAPGGFSFAPPYSPSFPSSRLGTPIHREAPASPLKIFPSFLGEPHAPAFLPWLPPAKGTRHQRDFSANLARKNREISAKNALKT